MHTFHCLLTTHCFQQAFGSPWRLTQVPQIQPLADIVHSKYSFTYLLITDSFVLADLFLCDVRMPQSAEHNISLTDSLLIAHLTLHSSQRIFFC